MSSNLKVNTILPSTGTTVTVSGISSVTSSISAGSSITGTTFYGSGANLTNLPAANLTGTLPAISGANLTSLPTQVSITGNADNRVITGGSGVNLNGETGLTYNGQALNVNSVTSENNAFRVYNTSTSATTFQINGEGNSFIGHTYPRSDANLDLGYHSGYRWRDVVLSGGIRFGSANSDDYFDDYEEGTFTPNFVQGYSSITYNANNGFYTKIGNHVSYSIYISVLSAGGQNAEIRIGLPFTTKNQARLEEGAYIVYDYNFLSTSNDEKSNCYIQSGRNYTYLRLFKNNNASAIFGNDTTLGTGGNNTYLLIKGFLTTA